MREWHAQEERAALKAKAELVELLKIREAAELLKTREVAHNDGHN